MRDVYTERRHLVTEYSRARCDTTHAYVVSPTTSELILIRVHRGFSIPVVLNLLGPCPPAESLTPSRDPLSFDKTAQYCVDYANCVVYEQQFILKFVLCHANHSRHCDVENIDDKNIDFRIKKHKKTCFFTFIKKNI